MTRKRDCIPTYVGFAIVILYGLMGCTQTKGNIPFPPEAGLPQAQGSNKKTASEKTDTINTDTKTINKDTDIVDWLLKSRGLTRETARLDPQTLDTIASQQVMIQPNFLRLWKNPWEFPKFVYGVVDGFADVVTSTEGTGVFDVFGLSAYRTGHRAAAWLQFIPSLEPDKDKPIQKALEELARECKTTLTDTEKTDVDSNITKNNIPYELQIQIAKIILGAKKAKYFRDRAFRKYPKEKWQDAFDFTTKSPSLDESSDEAQNGTIINWDFGQAIDYDDLLIGASLNLKVICELDKFLKDPKVENKPENGEAKPITPTYTAVNISELKFEINTPLGKIAFNSKNENNTYQGEDYLAIIDMAGNDTYTGAAAASYKLDHPISTIIDCSGDDTYESDKNTPCSQGAGIMGYGFLIDDGGNDTFTAVNNAQGMCCFGVGILWARGGDDNFKGHTSVQGSAAFGVANLVKIGGNDSYYAYYTSQGFGFVGAYGVLIDTGGNDKYVAEPYDLIHPGVLGHDNLRNYNFCQGAGWGQRGDMFPGHSMAGGTGILEDLGGDDWYECGVYGQATAYWYGTGILYDKSGNDHYEGSFWVQSGTPHMGMTMFIDEAGNDTHHIWHAISLAGAHDFSVAFFLDKGGDNKYSAWEWKDKEGKDGKQTLKNTGIKGIGGGVMVGSAINNSIGVFMSIGGNDTYEFYTNSTFGFSNQNGTAGSWRYINNNIGIFIDVGGNDTFNTTVEKDTPATYDTAKSNAFWSRMPEKPGNKDKTFSMGINTPVGKVPEAER